MKSALVVIALAGVAHAGTTEITRTQTSPTPTPAPAPAPPAPAPPPPSPPDPATVDAASEANLESNAPRAGVVVAAAIGAGLTMGDGVGRGPALSLRLGHVATPSVVMTFEIVGGSLLHQQMTSSTILHNDDISLMAGALLYVNRSLWVRAAGGATTYTEDNAVTALRAVHGGVGGLVGVGVDLVRWHYLVLGLETFDQLSIVSKKGLLLNNGLCLGLTYY